MSFITFSHVTTSIQNRKQFLKSYFYKKPNVMKFNELFSTKDTQKVINLAKYVDIIMKRSFWLRN